MLSVSNPAQGRLRVILLRPLSRVKDSYQAFDKLAVHDIELIERSAPGASFNEAAGRCHAGLLLLNRQKDLQHLDSYEKFLRGSSLPWIGLIADDIAMSTRLRRFIDEYLFSFMMIPADQEHIAMTIRQAHAMSLVREAQPDATSDSLHDHDTERSMVGKSAQMQRLFEQIRKVAKTDAAVLIAGPSGSGKELAALSIHRQSSRKNAPFVAVNCGAIATQLFQSELFGHEKGAFTGAHQRKIGRIEAAKGGTLFLDEIGDMPYDMQVNLLRFLQEKTIERVGGTTTLPVDVRVIAATHIDLPEAVRKGKFREDLYYRLNVICIHTPKLADRSEDIEEVANFYLAKFANEKGRRFRGFSSAAMNAMRSHGWPGNVRELVNRVQRAVVMAEGRLIRPEDLGFDHCDTHAQVISLEDARAEAERITIVRALSHAGNKISTAASMLGVSRLTLYRLIEKYDIRVNATSSTARENCESSKQRKEHDVAAGGTYNRHYHATHDIVSVTGLHTA